MASSTTATKIRDTMADLEPPAKLAIAPAAPDRLAECRRPFPIVKWKPGKVHEDKALAMAYVDARDVMDRLDHVFGTDWSDHYREVPGGVECSILIGNTTRSDVGEPGDGPMGKGPKAMYSDALKRAAVQYGVGRYLYDLPSVWVGYNRERKILTPAGAKELATRYASWLKHPATVKLYGEVLAHALYTEAPEEPDAPADTEGDNSAPVDGDMPPAPRVSTIPPAPRPTQVAPSPVIEDAANSTAQQELMRRLRDKFPTQDERKTWCEAHGTEYRQTVILDLSNVRAVELLNELAK